MKRLKKGPQVLRSSKTQRDTKKRAGHKKPSGIQKTNARPKTQRHVKNLPELEKPPRVGKTSPSWKKPRTPDLKSTFSLNIIVKEATEFYWRSQTSSHVKDNKVWEREYKTYHPRMLQTVETIPVTDLLKHDHSQTEGHDGTIRYRLVILAQCGNWRVWGSFPSLLIYKKKKKEKNNQSESHILKSSP